MPTFAYKARTRSGQRTDGTVDAPDRRAALLAVERMGHVPVSVAEQGAAPRPAGTRSKKKAGSGARARGRRFGRRMSIRELLTFTTELSDLLASGMTLGNALNALANRRTGKAVDDIVARLRDDIVQGSSLSDAMAAQPGVFSNLYVSMIRAGEASGAQAEVLRRLVDHYERLQEVKEKVVMALVYPAIVLVMGLATMVFSMVYVVPKFETVFAQLGEGLPLPTQILMGISQGMARYGWAVAIGVVITAVLANRAVKTQAGQFWWHGLLLRMPLIKGIVASSIYANLARTLGSLLRNGVPVLQSLQIVEKTVSNAVIERELRKARERVTDGTTISGPLAASRVFPPMMTDMMAIGEQTGDMAGALSHVARRYENELDRNLKIFTTALEPILIVVVAVMVGFVAVSILLAVFNLTSGLNI